MSIWSAITTAVTGQPAEAVPGLALAIAAVAPKVSPGSWAAAFGPPMRSSGITTPRRVAMFIGQCAHESAGFTQLVENTNYTHADRLLAIFPTHFKDLADAEHYAGKPVQIANRVYADRMGNGNEDSGDGWRFRGQGVIQMTGRQNWTRFASSIGKSVDEVMASPLTPAGMAQAACWWWLDRGQMLALSDAWDIAGVTRRVNGGLNGLDDRTALCTAALKAMPGPLS